ncbi:uncharacterized protein LY89DRAFT_765562 [Mollisia scopiformis]|uniref:Uncharacterized protein n=1 Tax=Mollisia scopiformis TaxID=149040 RepID=A0A132B6W3_MOLSC|nr:uncharacterized protein LY89DRAFT_765562 [Mollisia scopiformis]KUJ08081.1 hypothetical protein LY89DRAFT_765562 [Mollisia scopiformis]
MAPQGAATAVQIDADEVYGFELLRRAWADMLIRSQGEGSTPFADTFMIPTIRTSRRLYNKIAKMEKSFGKSIFDDLELLTASCKFSEEITRARESNIRSFLPSTTSSALARKLNDLELEFLAFLDLIHDKLLRKEMGVRLESLTRIYQRPTNIIYCFYYGICKFSRQGKWEYLLLTGKDLDKALLREIACDIAPEIPKVIPSVIGTVLQGHIGENKWYKTALDATVDKIKKQYGKYLRAVPCYIASRFGERVVQDPLSVFHRRVEAAKAEAHNLLTAMQPGPTEQTMQALCQIFSGWSIFVAQHYGALLKDTVEQRQEQIPALYNGKTKSILAWPELVKEYNPRNWREHWPARAEEVATSEQRALRKESLQRRIPRPFTFVADCQGKENSVHPEGLLAEASGGLHFDPCTDRELDSNTEDEAPHFPEPETEPYDRAADLALYAKIKAGFDPAGQAFEGTMSSLSSSSSYLISTPGSSNWEDSNAYETYVEYMEIDKAAYVALPFPNSHNSAPCSL